MHDSRKWRLLSYDIRDAGRYRRAYKIIQGYGDRLQYSLFRGQMDSVQVADLRGRLGSILRPEDDLLILGLCDSCAVQVVTTSITQVWDRPPPTFAVVRAARPMEGRS